MIKNFLYFMFCFIVISLFMCTMFSLYLTSTHTNQTITDWTDHYLIGIFIYWVSLLLALYHSFIYSFDIKPKKNKRDLFEHEKINIKYNSTILNIRDYTDKYKNIKS